MMAKTQKKKRDHQGSSPEPKLIIQLYFSQLIKLIKLSPGPSPLSQAGRRSATRAQVRRETS